MPVICKSLNRLCPERCFHSHPHEPILDSDADENGYFEFYCDQATTRCGYLKKQPKSICDYVKEGK